MQHRVTTFTLFSEDMIILQRINLFLDLPSTATYVSAQQTKKQNKCIPNIQIILSQTTGI